MEPHEELKKQVKDLISANKTGKALKLLTSKQLPAIDKELILLTSRFSKVTEEKRLGIAEEDDIQRNFNKINYELLALVEHIGEKPAAGQTKITGTGDGGKNNKPLLIGVGILVALLAVWGIMQMTGSNTTPPAKAKIEKTIPKKSAIDKTEIPHKQTESVIKKDTTLKITNVNKPPQEIKLGMEHGGGIVFYIDPTNKNRGLIMAPHDILDDQLYWHNNDSRPEKTGAFRSGIYGGKKNTEAIVQKYGNGNYPAKLCYDYEFGGFTDWYLPSQEELNELYDYDNHSGFEKSYYWSSTEISNKDVYYRSFHNGTPYKSLPKQRSYKNQNKARVRAIRSF